MRWLVVSPYLPHPRIGHGGGHAVLQLCLALAREHEAVLLCFEREDEQGLSAHLEQAGVRVVTVPLRSDRARGAARVALVLDRVACALRAVVQRKPLMAVKYDRRAFHRRLRELLRDFRPDIVQVEYSFMSIYARRSRFDVDDAGAVWQNRDDPAEGDRPHVLLNTHEIGTLPRIRRLARAKTPWSRWRAGRELAIWAAHDRTLIDAADTVLCVTEQDRILLRTLTGSDHAVTVALGADVAEVPLHPARVTAPHLLFVGSFTHPPNVDGVLWFCDEVLPLVWRERADVAFEVVGRDAPPSLHQRAAEADGRIRLLGFVDDLDPVFARNALFVAPLISGGGIKIKVLEAMGRGAAVVTTPIGAEGIDEQGEACVVCASPEAFAAAILRLLDDPGERDALASRAHARIEQHFSWAAIVGRLARIASESRKN